MQFDHKPLHWENEGVEPTEELKRIGFVPGYKPPASYFNYKFAQDEKVLLELQEKIASGGGGGGISPDVLAQLNAAIAAKLDASAYTAQDVLGKIKTVDGAESGLDAGLLDGKNAAAFALADHAHDVATAQAAGFLSAADKVKLDALEGGGASGEEWTALQTAVSDHTTAIGALQTTTQAHATAIESLQTRAAVGWDVTIPLEGWTGDGPFVQTIDVEGVLDSDAPIVDVVLSDDPEVARGEIASWILISKIVTHAGSITVTCLDNQPEISLNLHMKAVR